jgi:hypothetical protein
MVPEILIVRRRILAFLRAPNPLGYIQVNVGNTREAFSGRQSPRSLAYRLARDSGCELAIAWTVTHIAPASTPPKAEPREAPTARPPGDVCKGATLASAVRQSLKNAKARNSTLSRAATTG